eukprot:CAMPEP_0169091688 /NCGR_PEP_ID=MMETSP1015-20121227/16505_1 /TAXON_ID=342587 /ORGANISM="Karlodinium micrum, Strain CCMP2283" /LENGTH=127 /DNA_ID=CAMNT_0009152215 /DNA_START=253 /DNA_END=639 /DNA_ORIENTATION=+
MRCTNGNTRVSSARPALVPPNARGPKAPRLAESISWRLSWCRLTSRNNGFTILKAGLSVLPPGSPKDGGTGCKLASKSPLACTSAPNVSQGGFKASVNPVSWAYGSGSHASTEAKVSAKLARSSTSP